MLIQFTCQSFYCIKTKTFNNRDTSEIKVKVHFFNKSHSMNFFKILNLAVLVIILGCGGGSSGSSNNATSANSPKEVATKKLPSITFSEEDLLFEVGGGFGLYISSEITFDIGADVKSFQIQLNANNGDSIGFDTLIDPSGHPYLIDFSLNGFDDIEAMDFVIGSSPNTQLPYKSNQQVQPGKWTLKIFTISKSNSLPEVSFTIVERTHNITEKPKLYIEPIISMTNYKKEDLDIAFQKVKSLYNSFNIDVEFLDHNVLSGIEKQLTIITGNGDVSEKEIFTKGNNKYIRIFVLDEILISDTIQLPDTDKDLLGFNGFVSGVPETTLPFTFIAINSKVFGNNKNFTYEEMGEVIAHEVGHYLGLYHSTQFDGLYFDILEDTPQCPVSFDVNQDGVVDGVECESLDGKNLMFWLKELPITELSDEQFFVIQNSPYSN